MNVKHAKLTPVVTPAGGRVRDGRRPVSRPVQPSAPARRPGALGHPRLRGSVQDRLVMGGVDRPGVAAPVSPGGLTDRGIALVVGLLAVLTLTTLVVCATKFFGVSNAPIPAPSETSAPVLSTLVVG